MSIWKGGAKKTKRAAPPAPTQREVAPLDVASVLPDVVAGLSLGNSAICARAGGMTKGFASHFSDIPDPESEGRREPRLRRSHQPNTHHGLGALSVASGYVPQPCFELSSQNPAHDSWPKREEASTSWNDQAAQAAQPIEFSQHPNTSTIFYQESAYPSTSGQITVQDVRLRSMSSDPHGYRNERNKDQRVRCSSATRCRPPRFKPKCAIEEDAAPLQSCISYTNTDIEPTSPTNCRALARIDYQAKVSPPKTESGTSRRKVKQSREEISQARAVVNEPSSNDILHQQNTTIDTTSYGYQIPDLDALLTEATPNRPANLPMVLASPSRLHNMRRTQEDQTGPIRPFLPLGIIVNAVFKTRDWLYIRTAHGAEGYVPFRVCLPLGIIPQNRGIRNTGSTALNPSHGASPWELRGNEGAGSLCSSAVRNPSNANDNVGTLQRGRNRERRRIANVNSNQTDMQKLQPESVETAVEAPQGVEQRINISATSRGYNIPHYV